MFPPPPEEDFRLEEEDWEKDWLEDELEEETVFSR